MKKILAYSFFYIVALSIFFAPSASFAASRDDVVETVYGADQIKKDKDAGLSDVASNVLSKGAGYFDSSGNLIKNWNQKVTTYYKSDGKLLVVYEAGPDGIIDDAEPNRTKGNDDKLVGVNYFDQDGNLHYIKDKRQDIWTNDAEIIFETAKQAGVANDSNTATEYISQLSQKTNQASFSSNLSPKEASMVVSQNASKIEGLNTEIKKLENEISKMEDGPEKAMLLAQLEDLKQKRQTLIDESKKNNDQVTAYNNAAVAQQNPPSSQPQFPGLGSCGHVLYNAVTDDKNLEGSILACVAAVVNAGMVVATAPFSWSAELLDYVNTVTVTNFGSWFGNGGKLYAPVNNIWQLIKNICNLFFITALIYIAVKTIIQADGFQEKDRLKNVIIFAFLINFSMFFTKIMIDVSNTASLQVFNVITQSKNLQGSTTSASSAATATGAKNTLADVFLANMQIQKFVVSGNGIQLYSLEWPTIIIQGLFSIIFLLVATIVIAAIAGMITIRFVMLVLLLMTSPIAYIGSFVPSVIGEYSKMWWSKFKQNLIFLPVLMIMFYITMTFCQFAATQIKPGPTDYPSLIFSYVITIAMLVISLSVAQMTGGSAAGTKFGTAITAGLFARGARRVVGGGLGAILNNKTTRGLAASNNVFSRIAGRALVGTGSKAQKATFDVRNTAIAKKIGLGEGLKGGISDVQKAQQKAHQDALEAYKKDNQGLKLSESEKKKKEQAEAALVALANQNTIDGAQGEKTKAEEELEQVAQGLGNIESHIIDAESKIQAEKIKVEADITAKFAQEEKDYKDHIAKHEADANDATKTNEQRVESRKKANESRSALSELSNKKSAETEKELERRMVSEFKDLDSNKKMHEEMSERADELSGLMNNADESIKKSNEKIKTIAESMQQKGLNVMNSDGTVNMSKYNDIVKNNAKYSKSLDSLNAKETSLKTKYIEHLSNGQSSLIGMITGRNKVVRDEMAKLIKEGAKSKEQKIIEEMVKAAAKAEKDSSSEEKK